MATYAAGVPVKMKKKQKKNAFILFCDDQKPRLKKNGFWDGSQAHIVQLCQHEWKDLPESEKELYKARAKSAPVANDVYYDDHGTVGPHDTRMDSTGQLLSDRVNPTEVLNARRKKELDHILKHLAPGTECCDQKFLFIHFEPLVSIDGKWYPCELSIIEYCLADGVGRSYHKFVHPAIGSQYTNLCVHSCTCITLRLTAGSPYACTMALLQGDRELDDVIVARLVPGANITFYGMMGKLPVGSKARVKDASEQTHKVPLSGFEQYESDYAKVWDEIINFASIPKAGSDIGSNEKYIRPLFTGSLSADCVSELLSYIATHAHVTNRLHDKVFEVEALCKALGDRAAKHAASEEFVMTQTVAEKCIEHAATAYASDTLRCLFHKGIDDECVCSVVAAKKYGFLLSEKLCPAFKIDITERHVPNMGGTALASMSSFTALRGVSAVPSTYNHPRSGRYQGSGGGSSAGFAQHQAPSHFAPARDQQREYQQQHVRTIVEPRAPAGAAAGRGAGRGSIPTSSTAPPGSRPWASTAAPLPGTAAVASAASQPPGMSRPPGAMAWGSGGASSQYGAGASTRHNDWAPPANFPAVDVRELEKAEAGMLSEAMSDATLSGAGDDTSTAVTGDDADGWETAGSRKQKRDLGRGRGVRTGPREPLRRPRDIQGPRIL